MKLFDGSTPGAAQPPETSKASANLILRARQGDEAAWEALVRQYQQPAFRLAYLFLEDAAEAEDVAQETFLRTYQSLHRFDISRPLLPWLLSIAANLARNRRRSIGRFFGAIQRLVRDEPKLLMSDSPDVEQRWEAQALWSAVRSLSFNDQKIVYLRYFLDMSVEETAQAMEVAPGTVKSRLHRALKRLREVIDRDYPDLKEIWV